MMRLLGPWLLRSTHLVDPQRYRSFAAHIEEDAATLTSVLEGLEHLETLFTQMRENAATEARGYFTPDEDDAVRRMMLSYRNLRLAIFSAVWRYIHFPRETDPTSRLRGFVLGYAAALALYSKSLRFIQACDDSPLLQAKLNEPESRFGIDAGFFDEIVQSYCSLRYQLLFVLADRYWRKQRDLIAKLELENDPAVGGFIALIREQRVRCWQLFWPTIGNRLRHESRSTLRSFFAPVRATGYGAQTLLGHAVGRMRTTLDYKPAIGPAALEYLRARLRPGDVLFTRTEHKVTTALLPGFFAHTAIYLGTLDDLQRLRLTHGTSLADALCVMRNRAASREWVLEALPPRVTVRPLDEALACDHVLALRPQAAQNSVGDMLREAFSHFGKPCDFDFDFGRSSHIVCSELVYRALHGKCGYDFQLIKRMGRYTLTVDDIVRQSLQDIRRTPQMWSAVGLLMQGPRGPALPVDVSCAAGVLQDLVAAGN